MMNKASIASGLLFLFFVAFAMNVGDTDDGGATSLSSKPSSDSSDSESATSTYVPTIPTSSREDRVRNIGAGPTRVLKAFHADDPLKDSVSQEKDRPKMGPGSFVYLRNRNSLAVLDNENGRVIFYPNDERVEPAVYGYPSDRYGLGLAVDSSGRLVLMTKRKKSAEVPHPYYELWRFDDARNRDPWGEKSKSQQKFSFSNGITHGAAASLEIQAHGDGFLFKGMGENEFHTLDAGQNYTKEHKGFPNKSGNLVRLIPSAERTIEIQEVRRAADRSETVVNLRGTDVDMDRLNTYRLLPNGTLALDLEADDEKGIPRQVVLMDPKSGQVKARVGVRTKDEIEIDQDLFFQDSKLYQFAASQAGLRRKFEVLQTDLDGN